MSEWQPIETAPKDGTKFLAWQDGEVYVARYTNDPGTPPRLCRRTHSLFVHSIHHLVDAIYEGKPVKAKVEVETPWEEVFQHDWTLWTRGFTFAPTLWSKLDPP